MLAVAGHLGRLIEMREGAPSSSRIKHGGSAEAVWSRGLAEHRGQPQQVLRVR